MTATPVYDQLCHTYTRVHRFSHLHAIAGWDQATNMPPRGNEARAAALAEMAALIHRLQTDPQLADHIARAGEEPLSDLQRANFARQSQRRLNGSHGRVERPESRV